MPEGHTIHRLARDQQRDLAKRPVGATAGQERFRDGAERLHGQIHRKAEAWGKHLFHTFDSGDVLHVHLGLIGKWKRRAADGADEPTATTRLRLEGDDTVWDLTGPMQCAIVSPDERAAVVAKLGPDPLRRDAKPEMVWDRLQRSSRSIGLMLMEQDVVAGIGNVYRSEILNIVGIDPRRAANKVTRSEFDAIWAETVDQLRAGVRRNRIVTRRPEHLDRPLAKVRYGDGLYAYRREHCARCHTELDIFALAGRNTWSCPTCQPR